ncbi:MAG: hypothetical protein GQ575_06085 [Deltaproteobacteria bacterium]|nr:hypothetical protein [Deltaproteobacteria bacterium]
MTLQKRRSFDIIKDVPGASKMKDFQGTRRDYSCAVIIMPEVERALQMGSCKRYQAGGLVPGGEDIDGSS